MNATHERTGAWVRTEVVAWSEYTACIVYVVTLVTCEGVEILARHIDAETRDDTLEPLVGEVISQFDVGNLPVVGILDVTL